MAATGANFTQIGYVPEVTFGTTPSAQFTAMRYLSDSMVLEGGSVGSQEIRSDRLIPDQRRTSLSVSGDLSVEMSYGAHDALFESLFYNVWTAAQSDTETTDLDIADTSGGTAPWTATMDSTDGIFAGLRVGDWFRLDGSSDDGWFRVDTWTSANAIVASGEAQVTGGLNQTGVEISFDGSINVGSTRKSFSIEKGFDPTDSGTPSLFHLFNGVIMSEAELAVATGAVITNRFGVVGLDMAPGASTASSPTSLLPAATNDVMDSVESIKAVLINGASTLNSIEVQSLNLSINNNVRSLTSLGRTTAFDVKGGSCEVSGSGVFYFGSNDLVTAFKSYTPQTISFRLIDGAGNAYIVDLPRCRLTAAPVPISGINQDVFVNVEFSSVLDPTSGNSISISRIAA